MHKIRQHKKVKITLRGIALQTEENKAPLRSLIRLTLRGDLWHTAELYYPNGGAVFSKQRSRFSQTAE